MLEFPSISPLLAALLAQDCEWQKPALPGVSQPFYQSCADVTAASAMVAEYFLCQAEPSVSMANRDEVAHAGSAAAARGAPHPGLLLRLRLLHVRRHHVRRPGQRGRQPQQPEPVRGRPGPHGVRGPPSSLAVDDCSLGAHRAAKHCDMLPEVPPVVPHLCITTMSCNQQASKVHSLVSSGQHNQETLS